MNTDLVIVGNGETGLGTEDTREETRRRIERIKATVAQELDDVELELFLYTARMRGLDPLLGQVYAVKRWNEAAKRKTMTIQVGIDGYRLMADRTGAYCGNEDPLFEGTTTDGYPALARVTVWKIVGGQRCAFTASARWSEYYPEKAPRFWQKMPHVMLGKVAEALALRKGFPAELSGIYTTEEMAQADREEPADRPAPAPHAPQKHTEGRQQTQAIAEPVEGLAQAWADWNELVTLAQQEGHWEAIIDQPIKGKRFRPPAQDASLGVLRWYLEWLGKALSQARDAEAL